MQWRYMTNPQKLGTEHIDLWLHGSLGYHFSDLAQALWYCTVVVCSAGKNTMGDDG